MKKNKYFKGDVKSLTQILNTHYQEGLTKADYGKLYTAVLADIQASPTWSRACFDTQSTVCSYISKAIIKFDKDTALTNLQTLLSNLELV